MKLIEKLFFILFPLSILRGSSWEQIWKEEEKNDTLKGLRIFFIVTTVSYILHYYTVDRLEGLAPSPLWFKYRFGMVALSIIGYLSVSLTSITSRLTFYRMTTILIGAVFCYFQTRTIIWYPPVPYLYSFVYILVIILVLRTSLLKSLAIAIFYMSIIGPTLFEKGISPGMTVSACFVTIISIVLSRVKYLTEIQYFLETQKNIAIQKKIIEINMEFTNQIKAFLPAQISQRMTEYIQQKRMSIVQSIDEVLKPKRKKVVCLFSDIRGFTKGSSDLDGFVSQGVFPNVQNSTTAIENHKGISRKIGDLIFAYFDQEDFNSSLEHGFRAAMEISMINTELNEKLSANKKINRYILLSCGEAVVGNLSGQNSAIEITAIGPPVNFLSRIDEITKVDKVKELLLLSDIILSEEMYLKIIAIFPHMKFIHLDLEKLDVKIRDFNEETKLFILRLDNLFFKPNKKEHFV